MLFKRLVFIFFYLSTDVSLPKFGDGDRKTSWKEISVTFLILWTPMNSEIRYASIGNFSIWLFKVILNS